MTEPLIISYEHYDGFINGVIPLTDPCELTFFKKKRNKTVRILHLYKKDNVNHKLELTYFVGVDWIVEEKQAIYVEPKINQSDCQTNYLNMLFCALRHPEVAQHTDDLFEIKWNKKQISITQKQDLLTPLLVVQFLAIVKQMVRKGLKKSYYKVEQNLYGRVKGKVIVAATIKRNAFKNKPLNTWCSYDEFGLNGLENRLIKKALIFVQRFLPTYPHLNAEQYLEQMMGYIMPAFETVSDEVNIHDILHTKTNPFYKEYKEGIKLAKLILNRFGYNITNTQNDVILTPPFWIDMSKLFELYVLGLLKERFGNDVIYHFKTNGNELDYLLKVDNGYKMVVDAKYKPIYQEDRSWDIENVRQISGYARLIPVYEKLFGTYEEEDPKVIDCLIIYPEALSTPDEKIPPLPENLKSDIITPFSRFYKMAVKIPVV